MVGAQAKTGTGSTAGRHERSGRGIASRGPSRFSRVTAVFLAILPLAAGACAGVQSASKPSAPAAATQNKHLCEKDARALIPDLFKKGESNEILGLMSRSAYWVVHVLHDLFLQGNGIFQFIPRLEEMASSRETEWDTRLMAVKTLAAYYAKTGQFDKLRELRKQPGKLGRYVNYGLEDARKAGIDTTQADAVVREVEAAAR